MAEMPLPSFLGRLVLVTGMLLAAAQPLAAQAAVAVEPFAEAAAPTPPGSFWRRFAAGFASSILAHEAGHIAATWALGGHPSFGLSKGRPTVFSNLPGDATDRDRVIFSGAGLTVQALTNELILDVPHRRGGAFERGVLAGGIATAVFYATLGRTGTVSDINQIAINADVSKTEASAIFVAIAGLHAVRIARNGYYANFFTAPAREGIRVGIEVAPAP